MRTTTCTIRLLSLVKIGILFGFIDSSQQEPKTSDVVFEQDEVNNTLVVVSVNPTNVL
jgi:hypothetical protein